MMKPIRQPLSRGFTLIEVLVSLLIFAVLAVLAYSGLQLVIDARERTAVQASRLGEIQTLFTLMERDLEQTVNRGIRDSYGDHQPGLQGDSGYVEFTRDGWRNPGGFSRSNLQRIAYAIDNEDIVRMSWGVLDRAQDSDTISTPLINTAKGIEIRYMDLNEQWQAQWPATISNDEEPGLPRAVEVSIDIDGIGRITRLFRITGIEPKPAAGKSN